MLALVTRDYTDTFETLGSDLISVLRTIELQRKEAERFLLLVMNCLARELMKSMGTRSSLIQPRR